MSRNCSTKDDDESGDEISFIKIIMANIKMLKFDRKT
jgi:hypothetical protein